MCAKESVSFQNIPPLSLIHDPLDSTPAVGEQSRKWHWDPTSHSKKGTRLRPLAPLPMGVGKSA